MKQYKKCFC